MIAEGLDDFVRLVLPILEARGYFDRRLKGTTLRDHLGLPYRESRYARSANAETSATPRRSTSVDA